MLAPVPAKPGMAALQTGACVLVDHSALAPEIETFLAAGEPPIYLGFGSMRASPAREVERLAGLGGP